MSKSLLASQFVVITADDSVELADSSEGKFKRFWKQLAAYGEFVDPRNAAKKMVLDKPWADRIVENFTNGPIKRVPVPTGHPTSSAELAERTKGWLVKPEAREDGLYGLIEVRDSKTAQDIENGLIEQVSVAFDEQYTDKKTGSVLRDVLKHVGLVNDPYVKDMTEFQPALSDANLASVLFSDGTETNGNQEEEITMTAVKNDRDFAVEVEYTENEEAKKVTVEAGAEIEVPEDQVEAVTKQIADAVAPAADEEDEGEEELSEEQKALAERERIVAEKEAKLLADQAEAEFNKLLSEGKVVPAQKEAFLALSSQSTAEVQLSDDVTKTVGVLLSELLEKAPKIKLEDAEGQDDDEGGEGDEDVELTDEEKSLAEDFNNTPEELAEFKKKSGESK